MAEKLAAESRQQMMINTLEMEWTDKGCVAKATGFAGVMLTCPRCQQLLPRDTEHRCGVTANRPKRVVKLMGMEDATRAYSDEAFQALESKLSAHTKAAKLALEVLEDELGNRVGEICVQREDGTWDRSALSDDEQKYITECEAAIKALTDAMGGK